MSGFLGFCLLLVFFGFVLVLMRRRERAAFLDSESAELQKLRREYPRDEQLAQVEARTAGAAFSAGIMANEPVDQDTASGKMANAQRKTGSEVRKVSVEQLHVTPGPFLNDVQVKFEQLLTGLLPESLRIAPAAYLEDFMRFDLQPVDIKDKTTEFGSDLTQLGRLRVSFLVCDEDWCPVLGILLGRPSSNDVASIQQLFAKIDLPLFVFSQAKPDETSISRALATALQRYGRRCRTCGDPLHKRRVKGAGTSVWACGRYPECPDIIPVSSPQERGPV